MRRPPRAYLSEQEYMLELFRAILVDFSSSRRILYHILVIIDNKTSLQYTKTILNPMVVYMLGKEGQGE